MELAIFFNDGTNYCMIQASSLKYKDIAVISDRDMRCDILAI